MTENLRCSVVPESGRSAAKGNGMRFKSHPYYDDSEAEDWLNLRPNDWTELEPGPLKMLHERLHAEKPKLCAIALERIRAAAGANYLAQSPHPEVDEFLFFPIGEHGFRVYISFVFLLRPNENTPDSDFWWAIINCPYAVDPFPTGQREFYVIGLGWAVA